MTSEILWRCTECGKWSHAKRQPKEHKRFTPEHKGKPPEDKIVETVEGTYSHMSGLEYEGGWFVLCGPFEKWIAEKFT